MVVKVNKWRIYCVTENSWVYGWVEEGIEPSTCFTDTIHTINSYSKSIVDNITSNNVVIEEERHGKTGGHFRCEGFSMSIPANTTKTQYIEFPYDINLLVVTFNIKSENIGDIYNACYEPNYNGNITSNIVSPTNIANIDSMTCDLLNIGNLIGFKRLSDNHEMFYGEVINIDKVNNEITLDKEITDDFFLGDEVYFKIVGIKNINLCTEGRYTIGTSSIGATLLASTGKIYTKYENKSLTETKTFVYELEYLY